MWQWAKKGFKNLLSRQKFLSSCELQLEAFKSGLKLHGRKRASEELSVGGTHYSKRLMLSWMFVEGEALACRAEGVPLMLISIF